MPLKSILWQHFEKRDNKTAICLHCGKTLKTSGNTTNLKCHMESRHSGICEFSFSKSVQKPKTFRLPRKLAIKSCMESEDNSINVRNKIPRLSGGNESSSVCSRTSDTSLIKLQSTMLDAFQKITSFRDGSDDQMRITNAIAYMICKDAEPFSIVENKGFKKLIKTLSPHYSMPPEKVLKNLVLEKYDTISSILKNKIKEVESCTLTIQRRTNHQMSSFLIISAHFYDESAAQHLSSCTLGMFETNHRQSGEHIDKNIRSICGEWGIYDEKILAIVTDNEPDITRGSEMAFDATRQIPCFSHTLNLIGQRSIENVPEAQAFTNIIMDIVLWFEENAGACAELQKCTGKKLIPCNSQWVSNFYMIQRFLELWPYVNDVMSWNLIAPAIVVTEQISELTEICDVLRPLEAAVREIYSDHYLTGSLVIPIVYCLQDKLSKVKPRLETGKKLQRSLIIECEKNFRMIEEVQVLAIATVLDPRFKKLYFKDAAAVSNIVHFIGSLIIEQEAKIQADLHSEGLMSIFSDHNEIIQKKWLKSEIENQSDLPSELLIYMRAPAEKIQQDPFLFWKQMENTYPMLSNISRRYLSSCATCAPCSHLFSRAGDVASQPRNHLRNDISLELLFLQNVDDSFWNS